MPLYELRYDIRYTIVAEFDTDKEAWDKLHNTDISEFLVADREWSVIDDEGREVSEPGETPDDDPPM